MNIIHLNELLDDLKLITHTTSSDGEIQLKYKNEDFLIEFPELKISEVNNKEIIFYNTFNKLFSCMFYYCYMYKYPAINNDFKSNIKFMWEEYNQISDLNIKVDKFTTNLLNGEKYIPQVDDVVIPFFKINNFYIFDNIIYIDILLYHVNTTDSYLLK